MATPEQQAFAENMVTTQNSGDPRAWAALYAPDVTNHDRPTGRAGIERIFEALYAVFPDWNVELLEVIGDGDDVVALLKMTGTHLGSSPVPVVGGGLIGVEPTGKRVAIQHIHRYRLKDGLVQDHHAVRDDLAMMQQLGLASGTESAADISRPPR